MGRSTLSGPGAGILLGLAGAALVALGSWRPSLWYDEAATVSAATRSLPELWALLNQVDMVHGAYYLLMHAWMAAFGGSELVIRLPSALAVGAATAGVWALARQWADTPTTVLAAVVFLLLPRVTWMGIEGRSTAFTAAAAVWATYVLLLAHREPGRLRWWLCYAGLLIVGIFFSIYLTTLIPVHAIALAQLRVGRVLWYRWGGTAGFAIFVTAPLVVAVRAQSGQLGGVRLGMLHMARSVLVNQWFLGAKPTPGGDGGGLDQGSLGLSDLTSTPWLVASLCLAGIGWALVLYALLDLRQPDATSWAARAAPWLLPWLLLPSLASIAFTLVATPLYHPRYLAFCAPSLAILLAAGLMRIPRPSVRLIGVGAIVACSLVVSASQRGPTAKGGYDWAQVADLVFRSKTEGQGVYFAPRRPETEMVLKSTRLAAIAYPEAFTGLRDVTLAVAPSSGATLSGAAHPLPAVADSLTEYTEIWIIRWADYPEQNTRAEDELFRDAGLVPTFEWRGVVSVVTLVSREQP